mmetsp:Transcript_2190/g.8561  ORF Transcript_2190/g.8561 Transcript_2190/m.8561 type:complete len:92 (-) Transcript_2190:1514-1789(-)
MKLEVPRGVKLKRSGPSEPVSRPMVRRLRDSEYRQSAMATLVWRVLKMVSSPKEERPERKRERERETRKRIPRTNGGQSVRFAVLFVKDQA